MPKWRMEDEKRTEKMETRNDKRRTYCMEGKTQDKQQLAAGG